MIAIIRFPGSNCDDDTRHVVQDVLGVPAELVPHSRAELGRADAVILPGGFSYGDYLRGGAVAALAPVMEAVTAFARRGGPVLGICNGFQILTEAGLLPGQLGRNHALHFVCRPVHVRVEREDLPLTRGYARGEVLRLPIAHGEGAYHVDGAELERLEGEGRVVFRYCDEAGEVGSAANPNGSTAGIAGVVNGAGNVLGMMPHPERASEELLGSTDGRRLLEALVGVVA